MQLDQIFLSAVLPSQGRRVYLFLMQPTDLSKPFERVSAQFDFDPLDMQGPEKITTWALGKGADAYVLIGGQGAITKVVTKGRHAGEVRLSRDADNSILHRCLRIDVDISTNPDKSPYPTKQAGWAAVKQFLAATGMPDPLVVDSGYGLHVYWPFDRDLPTADWLALSTQLRNAMAATGLVVDPTATMDAARILRLPGTFNFKNSGSVPVHRLNAPYATSNPADLAAKLAGYGAPAAPSLMGAVPASMRGMNDKLTEGLHPPYSMRGVLTQCPGIRAQLETKGAQASEPLWMRTLAVVWKSSEVDATKERVARALSDGHPGFTEGEFQQKWAQVQQQNYEPASCETFAGHMPQCATCAFRTTHKSPVVLGRAQPQMAPAPAPAVPIQPAVAPVQPLAYVQGATVQGCFAVTPGRSMIDIVDGPLTQWLCIKDGFPCQIKMQDNPTAGQPPIRLVHKIGDYRITGAERLLDEDGKLSLTALIFDRQMDGHKRVEFGHKEMSGAREFGSLLSQNGIYLNTLDVKALQDKFMPSFLTNLQRLRQANTIAPRCGWTSDYRRFVLGTRIYTASGDEHIRPAGSPQEMEAYHVQGDRTLWREAFDLNIAAGPERQAILALGIAGPLMAFAGVDGVLLNAYSPESGVGKSTLCDAVLSIWGAPDKLRKDYRDTAAATFHLAAVSGNLPMVIDEFTNVDGRDLSNYVYTITQGRERHRLGADAKLRDNVNRWCLPAIATSNNSVHDKLQTFRQDATAEAARVFEMRLQPLVVDPGMMGAQKRILHQLKTNYGFLGPELVQLFMQKGEAYWRDKVTERISWWDQTLAQDTGDRFRSVVAALIEIGALLGKALGFAFDHDAVKACIKHHWKQQVQDFEDARLKPQDFITNYIADNITKMMVFGENGNQASTVGNDFAGEIRCTNRNGTQQLVAEHVLIPATNLRDYITGRNGNYKAVLEWLQKETLLPDGMCRRAGQIRFMQGTPRSLRMQGFALSGEIMGATIVSPVSVPTTAAPLAQTGTP